MLLLIAALFGFLYSLNSYVPASSFLSLAAKTSILQAQA
jgi:hypothetical protein